MAIYNLDNYLSRDGFGMSLNIRRGNPNPLDNSAVWNSFDAAHNYAKTDPTAYVGQILTVVSDITVDDVTVKTATAYVIDNEAGDLKEVGSSPVGDEKSVTVAEDGTISLYGIAGLTLTRDVEQEDGSTVTENITYQPLLVNGVLTWVEPSATTVEGLAAELEGLKTRVSTLENTIGKSADPDAVDGGESTGLIKEIEDLNKDRHTHSNKALLDSYSQTEENLADAVLKKHEHSFVDNDVVNAITNSHTHNNADILATITSEKVAVWETDYTVTMTETTDGLEDGVSKKYIFTQNNKQIGTINLAKELVVTSGSVKSVTEAGKPYVDAVVGDKYIELVIANQSTPIYIPAKDLVDIYTTEKNASVVQLTISGTNEISADVVAKSIDESKLSDSVVETLNKAHEHENSAVLDALTQNDVDKWNTFEKNVINAVEDTQFTIDSDRKLTLTSVDQSVVAGLTNKDGTADSLANVLAEKVNAEAGKGLSTNDLTDILKAHYDEAYNHSTQDHAPSDAEKNVIASVDTTQFNIVSDDEHSIDRKLTLTTVDQSIVAGLTNKGGTADTLANVLAEKMNVPTDGSRLITSKEATKLEKLVIADDGSVSVSGTIAAGNVDGLGEWITARAASLEGLSENNFSDSLLTKLNDIEESAEVNVIEVVKINGVELNVVDKAVNIGTATETGFGVVKSAEEVNKVKVAEDGTMEVNTISVSKLVNDDDFTLVLNGGSATII